MQWLDGAFFACIPGPGVLAGGPEATLGRPSSSELAWAAFAASTVRAAEAADQFLN